MLQIKLVQGLPHNAGLNPKSFRYLHFFCLYCAEFACDLLLLPNSGFTSTFVALFLPSPSSLLPLVPPPLPSNSLLPRTFHSHHQYLYSPQHKVLDGQLLWRYIQLSGKEKADFAKQIGTSVSQILEDLKEVDKVSAHF